jgi:hypothetical protein
MTVADVNIHILEMLLLQVNAVPQVKHVKLTAQTEHANSVTTVSVKLSHASICVGEKILKPDNMRCVGGQNLITAIRQTL